jgi:hypothetical protein
MKETWKMTRDAIVRKNLDLLNEVMQFAFETPEILDQVPPDTELIIFPENDPEVCQANQETLEGLRRQGKSCIAVHLRKPERIPPRIEAVVE